MEEPTAQPLPLPATTSKQASGPRRGQMQGIGAADGHRDLQGSDNAADVRVTSSLEAAGIEPERRNPANYLMANDFRRKCLESRDLPPPFECPGVPSSPLESTPVVETFWRRGEVGGFGLL